MNDKKEIKLCGCGCGKPVTRKRNGELNDYINHHYIKVLQPSKTESFKEKMRGENNPSKRPEVREKISKSLKGVYVGEKNHMKQEKYRKMFSEKFKGENNPMYGKKCPEQSERMKKNNPMYNKESAKKSVEHRMKISQARKKENGIDESNPAWNIFITPLYETIRKLTNYVQWREKVYERDSYICQKCGKKTGGDLNSHHKKPFSEIMIEYNIKSLEDARKCEELWDIDNGITLCKKCHIKEHSKK